MLYPTEQTRCENCDNRIRYVDGVIGGAWQHIDSISIYCGEDGEMVATPPREVAPR